MKLTVRLLDIEKRGVLIHNEDARNLGVLKGDRVQILNAVNGESTAAFVDTTSTILVPGNVGLYRNTNEKVGFNEGESAEISESGRPVSLDYIKKKMNGKRLTKDETYSIVKDIVSEDISPSELMAYITATYINTMDMDEIEFLTRAMVDTGEQLSFHTKPIVDKHSVGGVPGNKISLVVVPIIAASGLKIPKTSSRAITGAAGTADLMEVLAPVNFSATEVQQMTQKVGGTIVWGGATNIAPADDKIIIQEYPFKIDARGQMLASVMAKKYAVGANLVVIDIPVGKNTKVVSVQDGRKLARDFIELGERLHMKVECAMTYGSSPVGHSIGPNLEVAEALRVLEGDPEPSSLIEKSLSLAGIALEMSGKAAKGNGIKVAREILESGKALLKFKEIISIQGGDPKVSSADILPGKYKFVVKSPVNGYVVDFDNKGLITLARMAGSPQDRGAGILLHAKRGTRIEAGDPLFTIFSERNWRLNKAVEEGRRLMPVLVEGMLLARIPDDIKWE